MGGGAFSGKDPSKVDRSAAYMARYVSRQVVMSGLAERCELQLAYSIGVAEPVSILINTFGTGKIDDDKITDTAPLLKLNSIFPCLPNARSQHARSIPPDTAGWKILDREISTPP